jgi:5-methyltetrahydropteroyltriglutamate--homocysteine methyltransferase
MKIKTTVVGSYPVPIWLQMFSNRDSLRDAMMVVLKTQELAGIDVVADGELYRWDINHGETNGMIDYFVTRMDGIQTSLSSQQREQWHEKNDMAFRTSPAGIVVGPLGVGSLDLRADYELFRELTIRPKKFTVTSPYMLAKTLPDEYYGDRATLIMAIAEVLAKQVANLPVDVLQIDEANVTGHPDDGPIAAAGINRVLGAFRGEKAVHLCYGNYGGQTIQHGTYEKLLAFLDALNADHLVLELARRPAVELSMLREIRPQTGLGIGVIDIKDNEVETPDVVAHRIDKAATVLGADRIRFVHPDCGFWMLPRSVADAKMKSLVAGRDLFLGWTAHSQREAISVDDCNKTLRDPPAMTSKRAVKTQ